MEANQFARLGAEPENVSARYVYRARFAGAAPIRLWGLIWAAPRIWRRLVFHARWTALYFAYGRIDHRAKHALPANVKDKSNDSI